MLPVYSFTLLLYASLVRAAGYLAPQVDSIFILAGQSNMSGRGGVRNTSNRPDLYIETWDGVIPPESQPNSSVLRLNDALTWEEAEEPLHRGIDLNKTLGIGPGMPFATAVRDRDSRFGVIGLVPCAIGGTNITEWARGSDYYNQLLRRAAAASRNGGVIRGLLWYQGESDTKTRQDALLYHGRLKRFFTHVRNDLGLPRLPVIQVALATALGPYIDTVRKAQLELDLPNLRCVDAKGLPLQPDHVHLSTPAQVKLGHILADAFLQSHPLPLPN